MFNVMPLCATMPTMPLSMGTRMCGMPSATLDHKTPFCQSINHNVARSLSNNSRTLLTQSKKTYKATTVSRCSCVNRIRDIVLKQLVLYCLGVDLKAVITEKPIKEK